MTWLLPPDSRAMTHAWNELSPAVETVAAAGAGAAEATRAGAAYREPPAADAAATGAGALTTGAGALTTGAGPRTDGAAGILAGLAGTASTCPTRITFAYLTCLWLAQ